MHKKNTNINSLLVIADGLHYRYLVQTGIIHDVIKNSNVSVIFIQKEVLTQIEVLYFGPNVTIKPIPFISLSRLRKFHLFLRSCSNKYLSETLNQKNESDRNDRFVVYNLKKIVRRIINILGLESLNLLSFVWNVNEISRTIEYYNINLVITSTPGQKIQDIPFLYSAKKFNIDSVTPVYSWDNLTGKGPFAINPNRLVVWNSDMRDEAIKYHNYCKSKVSVGGVPVFDSYRAVKEQKSFISRCHFFNNLGLDSNIPLITITTIPPIYFGICHVHIANKIIGWIRSGVMPLCSVLIRPHPLDDTDYKNLTDSAVCIDSYGTIPNKDPRLWMPTSDNMIHLANTMAYSSVVLNIASTITIDAACFDTPIINVAYDFKENETDYRGSIKRYYSYTHYQKVVNTGAAKLVFSDTQLLECLLEYLKNPSIDRDNRESLVKLVVENIDGYAAKRTALAIMGLDS